MDTNLLFEKFTVDEIRNIEKRTRADIERKKEDLRTMVGERYRDLIEAADTITDMKNSAQNVMSSISQIENLCTQLKHNQMVRGSSLHQRKKMEMEKKQKEETKFYGTASQIKLLLDMPEKIWSSLDCQDFLTASRLFLLSRHINTSLHLESQQNPNFLYWFPVLSRQWTAISHFKSTILQGCRALLKEGNTTDKQIGESLCSILLLEDSNPRQVFSEFLLARTSAVQQVFHSSQQTTVSIKEQICTVVQLITNTVHQIHAVFYSSDKHDSKKHGTCPSASNLLLTILAEVTTRTQEESGLLDLQSSVSSKYLPKSVTGFCPSQKSLMSPVSGQYLQDSCQQWIQTCSSSIKSGVGKLLGFINTVKHLASIRDAVWDILIKDPSMDRWEEVCHDVLDKSLHIWQHLLKPLFLQRVKSLIKYQVDTSGELSRRQLNKVVMEIETTSDSSILADVSLANYIWSESSGDIPPNTAWTVSSSRSLLDGGGLMMKAKAYTPVVQSLCRSFDEKLKGMLEDGSHYLQVEDGSEMGPFDRLADSTDLKLFIQNSCSDGIHETLSYFSDQVETWKTSLEQTEDYIANQITGNKILLVGRLCGALCDLTPHLGRCMLGRYTTDGVETTRIQKKPASTVKTPEKDAWEELKSQLLRSQQHTYKVWVNHLSAVVLKKFKHSAHAPTEQDILKTCSRWDEISIDEETDDGKKISSKISVPMQASWYLQSLLYDLCTELNNMGSHSLSRSVLQYLVNLVSDGIVETYEKIALDHKKSAVPLTQKRALQLLFDMKFVLHIIPRKEEDQIHKRYQQRALKCVSNFEEIIDPFDLDVFSPYIQSHLQKQTQRCSVLYGILTSLDKSGAYNTGARSSSTQQEQHNILLLSSCQNRFSLLPLSSQSSRPALPQPVLTQSILRGVESGPSLTETAVSVLPMSNQEKIHSSSSFYDKLGSGLGSMSEISQWFSNIGSKS